MLMKPVCVCGQPKLSQMKSDVKDLQWLGELRRSIQRFFSEVDELLDLRKNRSRENISTPIYVQFNNMC